MGALDIGYFLSEDPEDDDKYEFLKTILHRELPKQVSSTRVNLAGLGGLEEHILEESWKVFGGDNPIFEPFSAPIYSYFDIGVTRTYQERRLFLELIPVCYQVLDFPLLVWGVLFENRSRDTSGRMKPGSEQLIPLASIRKRAFPEPGEMEALVGRYVNEPPGSLERVDLERIKRVFELALEREEDVIFSPS